MSGGDGLDARVAVLEDARKRTEEELKEVRTEVSGLRRFQSWLFGAGGVVGAFVGFFADNIREFLKH